MVIGGAFDVAGFQRGIFVTAMLLIAGGFISAIGITNKENRAQSAQ